MQATVINLAGSKLDDQLLLPLYFPDKATVIPFPSAAAKTNTYEWSSRAISSIRENLLISTLKSLTDGRTVAAKAEAMEWMLSDDIHPFSFRICAGDMGLDYIKIRNHVLYMIDALEKKMINASFKTL